MLLQAGKLPPDILARLLESYAVTGDRVRVGPSVGEDAAAIDMGDRYLLLKTDPITFVDEDIGTYAVRINANDIASMGGRPLWFLASILLPEGRATVKLAEAVFRQLSLACGEAGVSLCGGHTEISPGINRVIVTGAMIGEVAKDRLVTTGGARAGDDIILTKAIAIEGVSVIARRMAGELEGVFGGDFLLRCRDFVEHPGISVVKDAQIAVQHGEIHSMHDPTEGGLATGLLEVARASGLGLIVEEESIPVLSECKDLCLHYGMDPLGLIASGSLLVVTAPRDTERVLRALSEAGVAACRIGAIVRKEKGVKIKRREGISDLPVFDRDEITKVL
jgi:hydrogenase expression/formation protein HypE